MHRIAVGATLLPFVMLFTLSIHAGNRAPDIEPNAAANPLTHLVSRAISAIEVDGKLDESAWESALQFDLEYEVRPGENTAPPVRTTCSVTYDDRNVYFGFRAYDPAPQNIRSRFSDRDAAWSDDYVGIVLDTFNDQRRAYEMFVNPLGVQIDAIRDDVGGNYDSSWNAIWRSAGRIVDDGYEVEMAVPFNQIRFQSQDGAQTWGFDAVRSYPRSNTHHIGLIARDRSNNSYLSQTVKLRGMDGASPGQNFEIIPTVITRRTDVRSTLPGGDFDNGDVDSDIGVTLRWGITPNTSLNGAINPDFSQVEADVLQLAVNEQFALFFRETRPFFLEGADYFNTPLNLVYTRTVSDPSVAGKMTSKQGRHTWGIFTAQDDVTNLVIPSPEGSSSGSFSFENLSTVGRYRYDFGENSTVGATLTDRRGDGYANTVASLDALIRMSEEDSIRASFAFSDTTYNGEIISTLGLSVDPAQSGATFFEYSHAERDWWVNLNYENFGDRFRNDSGFRPQVGYQGLWLGGARVFWPDEQKFINRAALGAAVYRSEQTDGSLQFEENEGWFNFNGPRESYFSVRLSDAQRGFSGVEFDTSEVTTDFRMQAGADISFGLKARVGDWIDFANVRPADRLILEPNIRYRIGRHVNLSLRHIYQRLRVEGGTLFTIQAPEIRAIHQFNNRAFLRLIVQFANIERAAALYSTAVDGKTETVLTQALFTYKLNPQTALYAGYTDNQLGTDSFDLVRTDRTFFVKFGYAWVR